MKGRGKHGGRFGGPIDYKGALCEGGVWEKKHVSVCPHSGFSETQKRIALTGPLNSTVPLLRADILKTLPCLLYCSFPADMAVQISKDRTDNVDEPRQT